MAADGLKPHGWGMAAGHDGSTGGLGPHHQESTGWIWLAGSKQPGVLPMASTVYPSDRRTRSFMELPGDLIPKMAAGDVSVNGHDWWCKLSSTMTCINNCHWWYGITEPVLACRLVGQGVSPLIHRGCSGWLFLSSPKKLPWQFFVEICSYPGELQPTTAPVE